MTDRLGGITGVVRRRLLINTLADPAEVAPRLPNGIRPHVGDSGGVVVGCCLIEIDDARPSPLPAIAGLSIRAAAHRISVDVGPVDSPTRAVYVPLRHTDSGMAVAVGGRLFPGVHARADVEIDAGAESLTWRVHSPESRDFDIGVTAEIAQPVPATSEVAEIVIGTELGLSPGRGTQMESVRMAMANQDADAVTIVDLDSAFLAGFRTAVPAETLLMRDVGVRWRRSAADGLSGVR